MDIFIYKAVIIIQYTRRYSSLATEERRGRISRYRQ